MHGDHPDGLPTPVGAPNHHLTVRLVGPDAPEIGVPQMRSPAIKRGYHNRPDVPVPITPDGFHDTVDGAALKTHALARAPAYRHPRRVWFVEALPLASTGKTDRAALRLRAEQAVQRV